MLLVVPGELTTLFLEETLVGNTKKNFAVWPSWPPISVQIHGGSPLSWQVASVRMNVDYRPLFGTLCRGTCTGIFSLVRGRMNENEQML